MGKKLGRLLRPFSLIALYGELGAGKTCFTQGVAQGLGIKQVVASPTYSLIQEYTGECPLIHVDCYRLVGEEDAVNIGLTEIFSRPAVVVVEWPEKIVSLLPDSRLDVRIEIVDETTRAIHGRIVYQGNSGPG